MFRFSSRYFILTLVLFVLEVLIAAFMHDDFIRPTFGDFLVVILKSCRLKTLINALYQPIAIAALLIS